MKRTEKAEKNNRDWFRGQLFAEDSLDPEFEDIARNFLCGDVLAHGTLACPSTPGVRRKPSPGVMCHA